MASKKDMRRADLIVPYVKPSKDKDLPEIGSTASSGLPMAAMFLRNKYIGWLSVIVALQTWLSEGPESSSTGLMTMGMSFMAVAVTYLPLFMPAQPRAAPVPLA